VHRFSFVDTPADDMPYRSLITFFNSFTAASTDYISFSIDAGNGPSQWCAELADWYRDNIINEYHDMVGLLAEVEP
jgi:hypothetical protein